MLSAIMIILLLVDACPANRPLDVFESDKAFEAAAKSEIQSETENLPEKTGIVAEQILIGQGFEMKRLLCMDRTFRRYDCYI